MDVAPILTRVTLATTDTPAMAAFYDAVFAAGLVPTTAFGTTLYNGTLGGVGLVLCPSEVAGGRAERSRHQLCFAVADLGDAIRRTTAAGGTVLHPPRDDNGTRRAVVRDPDGSTIELEQSP